MSKNYPALYASANAASALEQKVYLKLESVRGQAAVPVGADFQLHIAGGGAAFTQPKDPAPYKSGRHQTSTIHGKTATSWGLTTFFDIDTTLMAAAFAEVNPAFAMLHKSMFGYEDATAGAVYDSRNPPDITFTLFEIGDVWSKQSPGAFVESANMTFPGDGQAQVEWAGSAKTMHLVGMGKSTVSNNGGNTITLQTDEGVKFPVGSKVMLIKSNNTHSTDIAANVARTVTGVVGDVVTVDGAVLADADGSMSAVYLVYYEPTTAVAIKNPQTGLVGSVSITGYGTITDCVRSFGINCVNNHELQNFCYGEKGLGGPLFTPGGRLNNEITMELNLSKDLVGFLNFIQNDDTDVGVAITLILGDATGRHLQVVLPRVVFASPEVSIPDTGSVPVSFTGTALQTAIDAANEITVSYI